MTTQELLEQMVDNGGLDFTPAERVRFNAYSDEVVKLALPRARVTNVEFALYGDDILDDNIVVIGNKYEAYWRELLFERLDEYEELLNSKEN